jgi:hypothetical protein
MKAQPATTRDLVNENIRFAKRLIPQTLSRELIEQLREITRTASLSIKFGDLKLLGNGWYVTHTGLVRLAARRRCIGIKVEPLPEFSDVPNARYAFKATVYKSRSCQGFVGLGDADPSNVSASVKGAEMRIAETRAVNRALRKAYGIGICSLEEISIAASYERAEGQKMPPANANGKNWNTGPKVRDWLCQVIRQHQLDPSLVKAYAIDFCGTKTLKEASREQVEEFVRNLSEWAEKDRNALLCQLNSYSSPSEGAA